MHWTYGLSSWTTSNPPFGLLPVGVLADLLVAGGALGLERREERLPALGRRELAALLLVADALPLRVLGIKSVWYTSTGNL